MKINKVLFIALILGVFLVSGCTQNQSITNDITENSNHNGLEAEKDEIEYTIAEKLLEKRDWDVQSLFLQDKSVEKIGLSKDGVIYALSEGVIYQIKDMNRIESISDSSDISTFHILEDGKDTLIIGGTTTGEIIIYSTLTSSWVSSEIGAYRDKINIIESDNAGNIYVGQSSKEGGGLWVSKDQGKSWDKLTDMTVRGIAIHPKQNEYIYVVDKLSYVSKDGGKNFMKINTNANYGILIHPLYSDAIYYASSIGVDTTDIEGNISSYTKFFLEGSMTKLQLNPTNINEWLMGFWNYPYGKGGLYYSQNHGTIWTQVKGGMEDILVHDIAFSEDNSLAFIATKNNGIWALNLLNIRND